MRDPFSIDWTKEPEVKKEPESTSLEVDLTDYSCTTWSMVENEGYTKVFHDLKPNVENHKPLSWLNETTGGGMGPSPTSQENLDYARSEQYLVQQELMGVPYSVAHANQTVAIRLWEQRVKEESWLNETTGSGCWSKPKTPPKDPCPHTQARAYKADGKVYVEVPMSLIGEAERMGLSKGWRHLKAHIDKALCDTNDLRLHATDSQCNESSLKLMNKVMVLVDQVPSYHRPVGIRVAIEEPGEIGTGIFDFDGVVEDSVALGWKFHSYPESKPGKQTDTYESKSGQLISLLPGITMHPLNDLPSGMCQESFDSYSRLYALTKDDIYKPENVRKYLRTPGPSCDLRTQECCHIGCSAPATKDIYTDPSIDECTNMCDAHTPDYQVSGSLTCDRNKSNQKKDPVPNPEPKIKFREFL